MGKCIADRFETILYLTVGRSERAARSEGDGEKNGERRKRRKTAQRNKGISIQHFSSKTNTLLSTVRLAGTTAARSAHSLRRR